MALPIRCEVCPQRGAAAAIIDEHQGWDNPKPYLYGKHKLEGSRTLEVSDSVFRTVFGAVYKHFIRSVG